MKDITFTIPEKPPKVYFTYDVNYLEKGFMSIKTKYPGGADLFLLNPKKKGIMTAVGLSKYFQIHIYHFTWEDIEGTYTAQLRKVSYVGRDRERQEEVVASDTTKVRHLPPCEEGFQECIHGELWKCVNEAMKLVEKNSKACVRDGFYNTNESVPSVLRLDVGIKDIMITKTGYEDLILKNLQVTKGKTTSVAATMVPKIRGYISCKSVPSGAGIWVKEIWAPPHAVAAAKTEITKSEFIAEIQKLGKINLSKIPSYADKYEMWVYDPSLFGGGLYYGIRFDHYIRAISIANINKKNPPTDVKDIVFTDSRRRLPEYPTDRTETFKRGDALAAIGKLPFVGFGFTGKVTPATIAFNLSTYAVKFKMGGYEEKVVSGVVVKEGKTTSVSVTLEKAEAPPPGAPAPPAPEEAKFGLREIENHLPEWISGYACAECEGRWGYKCPAGYKRTECKHVSVGSHGCCARCAVVFVKCESVIAPPPTTPPPAPPGKSYLEAISSPGGASIWLKKR